MRQISVVLAVFFAALSPVMLRNPKVQAEDYDLVYNMKRLGSGDTYVMGSASHGSYIAFRQIDLKNIDQLTYRLSSRNRDATLEARLDSATGPLISTLTYQATKSWENHVELTAPVKEIIGVYDVYFVLKKADEPNDDLIHLDWIYFQRKNWAGSLKF
ncbi:MAG: carbohydrate-binding protein [Cytophagaceae bacterium]|nr:carbohydrate-binding protein [Cytophagaceae bacterium]